MAKAAFLIDLWQRLNRLPGGAWVFRRIISYAIPYTGALGARVREVRPGYARVELHDRRGIRNHLDSIHAIALTNVGEFTGGLAMTAAIPPDVRAILTRIEIEFLKKARGTVVAECSTEVPRVVETMDHVVRTVIRDASGAEVARVSATWRLSPLPAN